MKASETNEIVREPVPFEELAIVEGLNRVSLLAGNPDRMETIYSYDKMDEFSDVEWESLSLKQNVVEILRENSYQFPSPVQKIAIPLALAGRDLLIRSKNGSGKTLSFLAPIISGIDIEKGIQAILLAPTQELVFQLARVLKSLCDDMGIVAAPLTKNTLLADNPMEIKKGIHIILGTPGRVASVLGTASNSLSDGLMVVLDEADRLLELSFNKPISALMALLPRSKQLFLCSATFPTAIGGFVEKHMSSPMRIQVNNQNLGNLEQFFVIATKKCHVKCLEFLLKELVIGKCIIYCKTSACAEEITLVILNHQIGVCLVHNEMSPKERAAAIRSFNLSDCKVLVSTDVTARGTDFRNASMVINCGIPFTSENYLHRIGRAGRFGMPGCVISIISSYEERYLAEYAKAIRASINPISNPGFLKYCKSNKK